MKRITGVFMGTVFKEVLYITVSAPIEFLQGSILTSPLPDKITVRWLTQAWWAGRKGSTVFLISCPTHSPSLHVLYLCLPAHLLFECLCSVWFPLDFFKVQTYFLVFSILFKSIHEQKTWEWEESGLWGIGKKGDGEKLVRIKRSSEVQEISLPKRTKVRVWWSNSFSKVARRETGND